MSSQNLSPADARRRRSAARLAAVQALYQHASASTPQAKLIAEFHDHRLGAEVEGEQLSAADQPFFDDLVSGTLARLDELDALIAQFLGAGWSLDRLDRLMLQILRGGAYELLARPDVPRAAVVSEYVDVAHAFYEKREAGFVNALLDRLGRSVRDNES
ncbi:transcription antitermination factor NusB [Sandaracinobacter neustonicus]|uniref:Transcription antitermination protein NusB n=1 Tax=Sandaracinobacter neustonicus TaxID=1715348 RepID=A0A501XKY3_9SPHN|nr:transcription antitermination factor NusB [Sandaracinobacter neustonicus]TPE61079.1 transcription antitermination factor NusB [Sandaracinobacter neustonicus]